MGQYFYHILPAFRQQKEIKRPEPVFKMKCVQPFIHIIGIFFLPVNYPEPLNQFTRSALQ